MSRILSALRDAALCVKALRVEFPEGSPHRLGAGRARWPDQLSRCAAGLALHGEQMLAARAAAPEALAQPECVPAMGAEGVEPAKGKKFPLTLRKAIAALRSQRSPVAL